MKNHFDLPTQFLVTGTALAASASLKSVEPTTLFPARITANEFLSKWLQAWNHHDAHQLGLLQTSDANTVNRFGTLVQGRAGVEKALAFLHNPGGPYYDVTAPPLQLIDVRQIASNVIILQASWQSPVMNPDGKLDLAKQNDMLVSYTLLKESGDWKATQMDLHNVEKMDLECPACFVPVAKRELDKESVWDAGRSTSLSKW